MKYLNNSNLSAAQFNNASNHGRHTMRAVKGFLVRGYAIDTIIDSMSPSTVRENAIMMMDEFEEFEQQEGQIANAVVNGLKKFGDPAQVSYEVSQILKYLLECSANPDQFATILTTDDMEKNKDLLLSYGAALSA